jgi:hypothetical protein
MKPAIRLLMLFLLVASMLPWNAAHARPEATDDRTLSPYFFVKRDDPALDRLPLKATSASVRISGVIADVLVTQLYKNEGKKPLEAVSQSLSKEDVVRKITEQTATLDSCFAGAKGKLVLRLTVSPDGTVKSVQVLSGTFKKGKAPRCVLDPLKKIRMSATQHGKEGRAVVTLSWG